jgi:hypothetical protein
MLWGSDNELMSGTRQPRAHPHFLPIDQSSCSQQNLQTATLAWLFAGHTSTLLK